MTILPASLAAMALLSATVATSDVTKPDTITFGSSVADIQTAIASSCTTMDLRSFDPPKVPIAKTSHQQIDCQGFDYMGEPRLAEFVFTDDRLQLVWILVDEDDQDRIIAAMEQEYGSKGLRNDMLIGYPAQRTAWRYEPKEILFYSEEVAPLFESRMVKPDPQP